MRSSDQHERKTGVVLLDRHHSVEAFDCGVLSLNEFLQRHALGNQRGGGSRTYVLEHGKRVLAYYSLAPGGVAPAGVPYRVRQGQAAHDVPVILLARLAVDAPEHGRGLGELMLRDAVLRAYAGAHIIGGRALLVHAKTPEAAAFYARFGFDPSPTDPLHLYVLMKDVRRALESGEL